MAGNGRAPATALHEVGADNNGRGRARVADIQRARMLGAMVQEISERGAANVSVAHVVARSGVSRRTFYEIFDGREDCFLAAFDDALNGIARVVVPAYGEPGAWRAKVRAGLIAALECSDHDRETARLLVVESLAAGPKALARRQSVLRRIIPVIEEGRNEGIGRNDPTPLTAEGILGGVLSVLHTRLVEDGNGSLVELAGPLMGMIVLPYLGPAAARKEIARPAPKHTAKRPVVRRDPLQDLEMRLTYRTVRVLTAVADAPGSSNRALGDAAGIGDQGQVSKLLARLQRLGLVENTGIGAATRGEPNAWTLTSKGHEVHDAIANVPA
jgi:AcrR family transcriptional regulator/DNA-binding MarR family transcriptional regulator